MNKIDELLEEYDEMPECEVCKAPVNPNIPGYYKSPSERFVHSACYDGGDPAGLVENPERGKQPELLDVPDELVEEVEEELDEQWFGLCHVPLMYNCGHVISAPPKYSPETCPECGVSPP